VRRLLQLVSALALPEADLLVPAPADLIHWPVPLNPNGNDPMFPKLGDGSRDKVRLALLLHDPAALVDARCVARPQDTEWSINDTWKQMEAILEKGLVKAIGVSKRVALAFEQVDLRRERKN